MNTAASPAAPERATFRSVFAVGEFRALWLAQVLSVPAISWPGWP